MEGNGKPSAAVKETRDMMREAIEVLTRAVQTDDAGWRKIWLFEANSTIGWLCEFGQEFGQSKPQ